MYGIIAIYGIDVLLAFLLLGRDAFIQPGTSGRLCADFDVVKSCVHHHVRSAMQSVLADISSDTVTPRTVTTGCFKDKEMWNHNQ
jgi:hypothetical protein